MIYLLLCILANIGIFICFRVFKLLNLNTFQAIVFNYITCVATGLIFQIGGEAFTSFSWNDTWVIIGLALGAVFISTFYLMAITTQKLSITVSSIASKMSLVIPVLVSLLILDIQSKDYTFFNYLGMVSALAAILLSAYKKRAVVTSHAHKYDFLLPVTVFFLGGVIDSSINYTNFKYLTPAIEPIFPVVIFASAACIGIVSILISKQKFGLKNMVWGMLLGVINYFSIYFLIRSLSSFNHDGALVYPLLNVGIILAAAIVSVSFFKERLTKINIIGLTLAIVSIVLISW